MTELASIRVGVQTASRATKKACKGRARSSRVVSGRFELSSAASQSVLTDAARGEQTENKPAGTPERVNLRAPGKKDLARVNLELRTSMETLSLENSRLREKLRQAQADLAYMSQVATMGKLAASLAHEIKQPIAAAVLNAQCCTRWLQLDEPDLAEACQAASRTVSNVMHTADIIDRVRCLYTRHTSERELVHVNALIRQVIAILDFEAKRRSVAIKTELAECLPEVMADRVQVQQVLTNLMLNAFEASTDGYGEVLIRSRASEDGQVFISVCDSGCGIPCEQADRIFDEFFTTKPFGTGMGLAISRSIVESHGGSLWAKSNSGRGATFCFTLPASQ